MQIAACPPPVMDTLISPVAGLEPTPEAPSAALFAQLMMPQSVQPAGSSDDDEDDAS
jgi:hypothetical protein